MARNNQNYIPVSRDSVQSPYKEFTYVIPNGGRQRVDQAFTYFRLLAATGNLSLNFAGSGGDTTIIGTGIGIEYDRAIEWVELVNNSGGTVTCTVALCIGSIQDSRFIAGGITTVNQTRSATINNPTDVTLTAAVATLIIAANSAGRDRLITSDPANTANIRIGNSSVAAAAGVLLQPGQSIVVTSTAGIFGFATPAGQKVSITETAD